MIELSEITVRFGGVEALGNLTSTMSEPICGIIGPNGAGKTTLLNVMSGFVEPASGRVLADDVDLLAMPPHLRARWGLRRTFQTEQVVDDLSAEDNVRTVVDPLPLSRGDRERELQHAIDYVGLSASRHTFGASLSIAERKLTEIAKTLVGNPRIILLDEPGGGMSGDEAQELQRVILGIPDAFNAQVVLIDHDVSLIQSVCSQTIVLDFGRKIADAETDAVLADPAVRAAYLGEEPVT